MTGNFHPRRMQGCDMKLLLPISPFVLFCLVNAGAQTADIQAKLETILYLKKLQTPSGGFLAQPPAPKSNRADMPPLRATSAAIRAWKYLGGQPAETAAIKNFVASCFHKDS